MMGRRKSTPPPPKPRGGLAALAGRGGSQPGSGVDQYMQPPLKRAVEDITGTAVAARRGTSITVQPEAPLLLGPGPRQRASKRRDGEAGRRGPVEEFRYDPW
jgi:hypothetical protein